VTGPERESFRELRSEMREGFSEIKVAVTGVHDRVAALELHRAREEGADQVMERRTADYRWRVGIVTGIAVTGGVAVLNLLLNISGLVR